MAVPKKRTGSSAQGHRRSNWKASVPETTVCKECGALVLTHTVCTECGKYKGKVVSRKAEGFSEETAEVKKPAKKAAKAPKKTKKEEVKEVETVTEETAAVEENTTEENTNAAESQEKTEE